MFQLAAFADEISADLDTQIAHCQKNDVTHFELRGVNNLNVLDFDPSLRREIKQKLNDHGMGVVSIGSPIGKVKQSEPFAEHFDRFKIAVELAEYFAAPFIRIFSYYEPTRDEVLRRMEQKVAYLADRAAVLVHENEANIYGQTASACRDMLQSINSPKLRVAFDFGNFVIGGEDPLDAWKLLKPYTAHFHIKDARFTGEIVCPGQGDGQIGPILKDAYASGIRGFLSLEPHLASGGQFSGFTGPDLFKDAADGLKAVCREHHIPLSQ